MKYYEDPNNKGMAGGYASLDSNAQIPASQIPSTLLSTTTAPAFSATGLTGATSGARFVGCTTSAAPATGTFAVGDYVVSQNGSMWVCTVAGSPGTWVRTNSNAYPLASDVLNWGFPMSIDPRVVGSGQVTVATSNRRHYYRVINGGTITKIGLSVTAQSGNLSVATYSNTGSGRNAMPGTRTATSGSVAVGAIGYQEISIGTTVTLNPGDWLSISVDNTTATFAGLGGPNTAIFSGIYLTEDSAFTAPATATPVTTNTNRIIALVGIP